MPKSPRRYWLLKSEPDVFSYDDLEAAPKRQTFWDGVRNYQARNTMRDDMKVGDGVLYYHSNAKPPGVIGVARVVGEGRFDPTQFDEQDGHYDPKAKPEDPRWFGVDVEAVAPFKQLISITELKANPALAEMALVQRGQRLSVQPVSLEHWKVVLKLGGVKTSVLSAK